MLLDILKGELALSTDKDLLQLRLLLNKHEHPALFRDLARFKSAQTRRIRLFNLAQHALSTFDNSIPGQTVQTPPTPKDGANDDTDLSGGTMSPDEIGSMLEQLDK